MSNRDHPSFMPSGKPVRSGKLTKAERRRAEGSKTPREKVDALKERLRQRLPPSSRARRSKS